MSAAFSSSFAAPASLPAYMEPVPALPPPPPSGTFAPGTKVQVGGLRVVIEKYLSEGGFAHVYLVRLPKAIDGVATAVLKRVAVPDKEALASMRTEVETMKKLKGRRHIVKYIDSHASQLKGGGYEVFLLMEYCNGGGLIDYMNTRLQNRLTEPEILKIFSDVAQGVADMHYLKPPLLHRDLKVENVLISSSGSARRYKLCDFGSAAAPGRAATTAAEGRLIEDDVQKHTTLQYRSPEMIDVYRKQPINEKSDIWALGVLLYKLCYYKTPFEEQGQMAILNASFKFPGYPLFSDNLKRLIALMLRENPQLRPNIYQVLREVCLLRGTDIPLKDIYGAHQQTENRLGKSLPASPPTIASPPMIGVYITPNVKEKPVVPEIAPMRRGRPSKIESGNEPPKPNPSPMRGVQSDPFTALDINPSIAPSVSLDDVSTRFPPIDEFSILTDSTAKFAFDLNSGTKSKDPKDISQRVTDALADDAFAKPSRVFDAPSTTPRNIDSGFATKLIPKDNLESTRPNAPQLATVPIDMPSRPTMVSTGTMTSPSPPSASNSNLGSAHRAFASPPSDNELSSRPQVVETPRSGTSAVKTVPASVTVPRFLDHRSKSHTSSLDVPRAPGSSRPSLEGQRPSKIDLEGTINRSKSTSSRSRPSSVYVQTKNALLGDQECVSVKAEKSRSPSHTYDTAYSLTDSGEEPGSNTEAGNISSDVEFLRAMEEEDPTRKKEKRLSSGSKHIKRASMPSISLSSTKSLLAGRFGDAFRRFETNMAGNSQRASSPSSEQREKILTPIAGSEATDGRSDDGHVFEETEPVPPEVRRELERRRLSQEEKRVANAALAHRQKISRMDDRSRQRADDAQSHSRAASIQSKVKTLLGHDKGGDSTILNEGFNRYPSQPSQQNQSSHLANDPPTRAALPHTLKSPIPYKPPHDPSPANSSTIFTDRPSSRPSAPPKPPALRTGTRDPELISEGVISPGADDWEEKFSKKYPSLAGLEMVEREIDLA